MDKTFHMIRQQKLSITEILLSCVVRYFKLLQNKTPLGDTAKCTNFPYLNFLIQTYNQFKSHLNDG